MPTLPRSARRCRRSRPRRRPRWRRGGTGPRSRCPGPMRAARAPLPAACRRSYARARSASRCRERAWRCSRGAWRSTSRDRRTGGRLADAEPDDPDPWPRPAAVRRGRLGPRRPASRRSRPSCCAGHGPFARWVGALETAVAAMGKLGVGEDMTLSDGHAPHLRARPSARSCASRSASSRRRARRWPASTARGSISSTSSVAPTAVRIELIASSIRWRWTSSVMSSVMFTTPAGSPGRVRIGTAVILTVAGFPSNRRMSRRRGPVSPESRVRSVASRV